MDSMTTSAESLQRLLIKAQRDFQNGATMPDVMRYAMAGYIIGAMKHLPGQHDQRTHGRRGTGAGTVNRSRLDRSENEFRHYAENDDAEVQAAFEPEYKPWADSLSSDEVGAIQSYTNGGYSEMNERLRGGLDPSSGQETTTKRTILKLDGAIDKAPNLSEDTIFYRGIDSAELHTGVSSGQIKKGTVLSDKGFMSTSPQSIEARAFAFQGNYPIVYKIKAEKGSRGAYLGIEKINSGHVNEAEFLLPRNAKLIVVNTEMKAHGGRKYAEIELAYLAD